MAEFHTLTVVVWKNAVITTALNCATSWYYAIFIILLIRVLSLLGYIGEFEIIDDHRSQKIVIELNGRLNKCGVISPRFDVAVGELEKWVVNLLPSRQFGQIILSTTYGIMTHEEARRKKTGGKVLGFFYWSISSRRIKAKYWSLRKNCATVLRLLPLSLHSFRATMFSVVKVYHPQMDIGQFKAMPTAYTT